MRTSRTALVLVLVLALVGGTYSQPSVNDLKWVGSGPARTRPREAELGDSFLAPTPSPAAAGGTLRGRPAQHGPESTSGGMGETLEDVFERLDTNKDGSISRNEWSSMRDFADSATLASLREWSASAGFWSGLLNSVAMIVATELGDKTFFIAAILAMRHSRIVVFVGCASAVAVMHLISVAIGFAVPALIPRVYTHYAAAALFAFFGAKLLIDARGMEDGVSEELEEVEEELGVKPGDDESGADTPTPTPTAAGAGGAPRASRKARQSTSTMGILIQAFTMTFLAEWGDRSQIAAIAMAAAKDVWGVALGGVIGHSLCTGLAVLGGRLLATRISEKTVSYVGGALFLVFAVQSLIWGPE